MPTEKGRQYLLPTRHNIHQTDIQTGAFLCISSAGFYRIFDYKPFIEAFWGGKCPIKGCPNLGLWGEET